MTYAKIFKELFRDEASYQAILKSISLDILSVRKLSVRKSREIQDLLENWLYLVALHTLKVLSNVQV